MRKILLVIIIGFFMAPGTVVAQQKSAKLCSALVPNSWRDTIVMPEAGGIPIIICHGFVKSVLAPKTQLGCTTRFGVAWGEPMDAGVAKIQDQNFPKPNDCNWQND